MKYQSAAPNEDAPNRRRRRFFLRLSVVLCANGANAQLKLIPEDPHTDINIAKLEGVQRRAARFVTNDYNYTSSVTAMMRAFEWESLQERRQQAKVVMMYRIVNSLVDIPPQDHLHQQGTAVTRGHQSRFMVPYSRTDTHRTAFFPSAIRLWNQLPESLVNLSSLDVFKTGIVAALST